MRKISVLGLLVALAMIVAACGDSIDVSEAATGDAPTTSTSTVVTSTPSSVAPKPTAQTETVPLSPEFAFDGVRALDQISHPSFADPLIDINLVVSGGPPPDGITPIDNPTFFGVDEA
jgi:hypothetical protein